jgi:hypothetical protein
VVRCDHDCHVVELCSEPGCRRLRRRIGGWCDLHTPATTEPAVMAYAFDLTATQTEELRRQVEADAQPLFIAAIAYILASQAGHVVDVALEAH